MTQARCFAGRACSGSPDGPSLSLSFSVSSTQAGVGEGTSQSMKDGPRGFLVNDTGTLERDRMMGVVMRLVVMKVGKEGEGVVGTVPTLPLSAV